MTTLLPFFPGFYDSQLDWMIDNEIEQEMENTGETYKEIEPKLDYRAARLAMSKGFVSSFNHETGLNLVFKELISPREYNFTTDKVDCELSAEEWQKIHNEVFTEGLEILNEFIKKHFTSRSGFISFYSNDLKDWQEKDRESFNSVECWTVLNAWFELKDFDKTFWHDDCRVYEAAQYIWKS